MEGWKGGRVERLKGLKGERVARLNEWAKYIDLKISKLGRWLAHWPKIFIGRLEKNLSLVIGG